MKALIFAAGLGTRLRPLTNNLPKALVLLSGKPLLEHVITKLQKEGINDFVINVHHFADKITDFLKKNNNFGANILISDETDMILETGGGLKKASKFFSQNEDFIVYNVDIFSDINIKQLTDFHRNNNSLATLVMQKRQSNRRLVFDENNYLCSWENIATGEIKQARNPKGNTKSLAFCGIHIINSKIFNLISETGKFSIIDVYLRLAKDYKISSFEYDFSYWFDLGKPKNLEECSKLMNNG